MSYTITLRGGDIHSLSDEDGFDLKAHWMDAKKPFPVELDEDTVMSSQIVKITKNKPTIVDLPTVPENRQLFGGKKCRGEFSIQREINQIARHDHPREWAKLIRDTKWREETRQKLLAMPGVEWCDNKAGKCACKV